MNKDDGTPLTMIDRITGNFEVDEEASKEFTKYYDTIHKIQAEAFVETSKALESVLEILLKHKEGEATEQQVIDEIKKIAKIQEERYAETIEIILPGVIGCAQVKINVER